jgi:hypothetical protein
MSEPTIVLRLVACAVLFLDAMLFGGASILNDNFRGTPKTKLVFRALCGAHILALACVLAT